MATPGKPLEKEIIDEAYRRYADGESLLSISRALTISSPTLHKYKDKQNWVKRVREIEDITRKKADSAAVARRRRQQRQYAAMSLKGSKALRKVKPGNIKPRDAIAAIDIGIKGEREILGDSESTEVTIKLRLPKGMRIETLGKGE